MTLLDTDLTKNLTTLDYLMPERKPDTNYTHMAIQHEYFRGYSVMLDRNYGYRENK